MRALGGLGLLGVLITIGIMYVVVGGGLGGSGPTTEEGPVITVAYGKMPGGAYELHVGGEFAETKSSPPRSKSGVQQWDEWIDTHFKLVDGKGNTVPLQHIEDSKLTIGSGKWDFLLAAPVKQGAGYELTFTPKGSGKRYRHKFSILPGKQMSREMFKPL